MSVLENRLRLCRHQFEDRRRNLAEFESLAQRLRADERRLQAEIERAVVDGNLASARPLFERQRTLAGSLAAIDGQIAAAGDALALATRELKRHELAWAQRVHSAGSSGRRGAPRALAARQAASPNAGPDRGD